ncbi:MAG: bifunctional oligoribonuclease/PAP phosphatase NrnA [Clostridia bacterium]|nr:bifunctional oligoribonuclease/PAP phosphatase NrnA [Clostridia bacterium]
MGNECVRLDLEETCAFLAANDRFRIITHAFPDGDTLGSGFALCALLRGMGKKANVYCPDPIPEKFAYLQLKEQRFSPKCTVMVDVADIKLSGRFAKLYAGKVDLCIDHHVSNVGYADRLYLDASASAACECIYEIAVRLGRPLDGFVVNALYTGISTDTGCFRFSNTTARTHRIAAELLEKGADSGEINRTMFETKSRPRLNIERMALDAMEFWFDGKCATLPITLTMQQSAGCDQGDMEGITSLPRTIEGVLVGVTFREKPQGGVYKVSVRTHAPLDAALICKTFGGGGHVRAAGCEIAGTLDQAKEQMLAVVAQHLKNNL